MNDHSLKQEFYRRHELSNAFNCQHIRQLTIRCIRQLMSVLDFLHQRTIIHRDIKPANILHRNGELQVEGKLRMPIG